MTNNEIKDKFSKQFPDWTITSISRMPWGAYIYAERNGKERSFTIEF